MYHNTPPSFTEEYQEVVFHMIPPNKTLYIQKLSGEEILKIGVQLQTIEEIFECFKPYCDVKLDKENVHFVDQRFTFSCLQDFDIENLIQQSLYFKDPSIEHGRYTSIIKQLQTNKWLRNVIKDPHLKPAFIHSLQALVAEIEEANSKSKTVSYDMVVATNSEQASDLDELLNTLEKVGGFNFLESVIEGIDNLHPGRKVWRNIFLREPGKQLERKKLKGVMELWMGLLIQYHSLSEMMEQSKKKPKLQKHY